jgi:hypothetical protein
MVDPKAEARKAVARAKTKQASDASAARHIKALNAVVSDLNPKHGPFDVSTQLGMENLNRAVSQATGKSLYAHRDEYMKNMKD